MGGGAKNNNNMSHNTVSDINTDTHFHVKNELLHILDIPSYEPAIYAWGVMRHGKTAQKDNES